MKRRCRETGACLDREKLGFVFIHLRKNSSLLVNADKEVSKTY